MSEAYIGEIRMFPYNFAPKNWALCNGQALPISQNSALFSILGTTYGGNGINTFALPNLQAKVPMQAGNGKVLGDTGGEASHTLTLSEMPRHTHAVRASSDPASQGVPGGNLWAAGNPTYQATANVTMNTASISPVGGGQAHENRPPFQVVNFCICISGIFPFRN